MRALIINVCAATVLAGCASKAPMSLVVVSVDADAPLADVATLHARVSIGTTTREFDVQPTGGAALTIPPAQTFGIDIPSSMTGTLEVHVEAHDSVGELTASGDGSGPIDAGARADLAVHLVVGGVTGDMAGSGDDMAITAGDMATASGDMVVVLPPMLTIDKTTQSFGDITVGKTSTQASFLIINAGGMSSSVPMLTTGGTNADEFAIDTDCGSALTPGARCHVTATVTPKSAGSKQATFTLTAAQGGSVGGMLTANALTVGAVKIVEASGNCGSSLIGTQSATTATFTVKNTGASPTTALTITTSDSQFQATGCNGTALAADAQCTVTVKFTPTASGTQNASVSASATTGGTGTASVVGVGLKPASLKLTPASYTFANAARGTAGEKATFTIANQGDVASAVLSAATLTGTNAASFVLTDNCKGAAVGPAPASCTIQVQFKPQVSGNNTATLNVPSSGLASVSLSGTGDPIWVAETLPAGTPKLNAVWAADPDNVYAVGKAGTILYRPKSGVWAAQSLGLESAPPDLKAISGSSSTNVFIAGGDLYQSTGNGQWNWKVRGAAAYAPLTGVWAFSSADVWATWDGGFTDPNAGNGVWHYTPASGWTIAADGDGNNMHGATALWGTSASDLFVYGGYYRFEATISNYVTRGDIFHRDANGKVATQFNQELQGGGEQSMIVRSLWGSGSPATNLYAVTSVLVGTTLIDVVLHSTGGAWDQMPSPAPSVTCDAVWGYDANHVFFGCADGVHRYDGATWTSSLTSTSHFYGLSGSNIGTPSVFAVGVASDGTTGVIYHYY